MPQVGNRKFPYTKEGEQEAAAYAAETGEELINDNSYGYARGGEVEYTDSGWGEKNFGRRYLSSLIPTLGLTAANMGIAYSVLKDPRRPEYSAIVNEMKASAPKGVTFRNVDFRNPKSMMDMFTGMPHYDPNLNRVTTGQFGKTPHPGIMAHELGHQEQFGGPKPRTKLNKMQGISRRIGPLATLPLIIADREDTAGTWAGIGTAVQAPTFMHEMDASMKGRKIMMDAAAKTGNKLGFVKSLGAFKGIPSYLLALASPYLIYKWLKRQGHYETPVEEKPKGMQAGGMMTADQFGESGGVPGHEGATGDPKLEIDQLAKPFLAEYLKAGVKHNKAYWLALIDIGLGENTRKMIAADPELQSMYEGLFRSNNINYLDVTHHRQSRSRLGLESPHMDEADWRGKQSGGFVGRFGF